MDDSRDSEAGAGLFSFSFSRGATGNVSAHVSQTHSGWCALTRAKMLTLLPFSGGAADEGTATAAASAAASAGSQVKAEGSRYAILAVPAYTVLVVPRSTAAV